jgi:hypothetical protein
MDGRIDQTRDRRTRAPLQPVDHELLDASGDGDAQELEVAVFEAPLPRELVRLCSNPRGEGADHRVAVPIELAAHADDLDARDPRDTRIVDEGVYERLDADDGLLVRVVPCLQESVQYLVQREGYGIVVHGAKEGLAAREVLVEVTRADACGGTNPLDWRRGVAVGAEDLEPDGEEACPPLCPSFVVGEACVPAASL